MTPLHCAAISHSVTVKASSTGALADESLQKTAENKLMCVDKLVKEGASLQSQVQCMMSHRTDATLSSSRCRGSAQALFCFHFLPLALTRCGLTKSLPLLPILQFQEIKSNKTVLHLAVKEGNLDLVRYLLSISLANMKEFVNMKVSPHADVASRAHAHLDSSLTQRCTFPPAQAHGHTALHMAAGLHGNPHQEEILRLLLSKGADPSIRNLENDQPAHLLQSGPQGEQVSPPPKSFIILSVRIFTADANSLPCVEFLVEAHAEEEERLLSSTYHVPAGPGVI